MSKTTDIYAETTVFNDNYDVFSDILNSLRIAGSVLLNDDYAPPWALSIPDYAALRMLLKLGSGVRVVAFHYVQRGHIEIKTDDGDNWLVVEAGEIVICFGGAAHRISQGKASKTTPVEVFLTGGENTYKPNGIRQVHSTSLICGVFLMHDVELNPLFSSLPALLHVPATASGKNSDLSIVLDRMAQEIRENTFGCAYVVERLLELLCAEALRSQQDTLSQVSGWFTGLRDPIVGRAITLIHAQPGTKWSIERLAKGVAMSPSRFTARFTAALGISPMAYVAKWRMNIASRRLQGTQQGIKEIALSLGYDNLSAFGRTFKRHLGITPAIWRSNAPSSVLSTPR